MSRVKVHTTEQPDSDTTTFVLSCDRLDVLDKTLQSYFATQDYPTKMVIVDDSAKDGIFETLVERYGKVSDVICFPRNRGQWAQMDFMVSWCDTDYIFYLEDDWRLLKPGYLNKSKAILQKYRNIGIVDISRFTYEWQGMDSFHKEIIDGEFQWKKAWQITPYHIHWYGWCGSPNLKRRDDLILLGRVEKWHNEWNIDRRFHALGFKAVFLKDQYADHIGWECSRMAGKRPNDSTTPEDYFPPELQKDRVYPKFDYRWLDANMKHPYDTTLVTMMVDIGRSDRNFKEHYLKSLQKILLSRHPVVVYAEEKFHNDIRLLEAHAPVTIKKFEVSDIESHPYFNAIKSIVIGEEWYKQSPWMQDSIIRSPHYLTLTHLKQEMLKQFTKESGASNYYWIDCGIFSSFNIQEGIDEFYFEKIPKNKFFMTSYAYHSDSEIHGFSTQGMQKITGIFPTYVCRASLFGGTKEQINKMSDIYDVAFWNAIVYGYTGTEESIYTLISLQNPNTINRFEMPTGDINNFLRTIK